MNFLLRRLASSARSAPVTMIVLVVVLTAVFGALSTQGGEVSGGFDDFATDTPAAAASDEITRRFGGQTDGTLSQLAVVQPEGDVISPAVLADVQQVVTELSQDPAITEAAGSATDQPVVTSYAGPVLQAANAQGVDLASADDQTVDQLYQAAMSQLPEQQASQLSVLLSTDAQNGDASGGLLLLTFAEDASEAELAAAREVVDEATGTLDSGAELYTFDFQILSENANDAVMQDLSRLLGVAFLLIILILVAIYRSVVDVLSSLVGLVFSITWMQGASVLLGPEYIGLTGGANQMAAAVPILLVGLGVDYGIHLTMRAREEKAAGNDAATAAGGAILAVGGALVLATLTTVVGFLTNLANPLPPLQDFGIIAAAGVVSAFLVMTTFVPAVRLVADRWRTRRGKTITRGTADPEDVGLLGRLSAAFAPVAVHHPVRVLTVGLVLALAAGGGITQLSTEFSQTDFFPEDSRALEAFEVIEGQFGGGLDETTRVLVEGDVTSPEGLQAIAGFQERIAGLEDVRSFEGQPQVQSIVTALARAGLLEQALADDPQAAIDQLRQAQPDAVSSLVTDQGDAAVLQISTSAGEEVDALQDGLQDAADATLVPAGLRVQETNEQLVIQEILDQLQSSQITGLLITLGASMLILALAFWFRDRAPLLGVASIVSVGVTTVWALGLMAALGIPFNVMTAMVSSLAVGIGVPFGIHVVNRFVEDRENQRDTLLAMQHTLAHTGGALVGSAITTVAGFGVLMFSSVPPMQQFGVVIALTIALALLTSITLLPAMLTLWARWRDGPSTPGDTPDTLAPARATTSADAV